MVATGRDRDRRSYLSYPHLPSKGREYRSLLKLNSSHKEKKLDHILGKQSLLLGFPAEQAGCTGNCCLLVWLVVQPAKWQPSPRGSDTEGCVCDSLSFCASKAGALQEQIKPSFLSAHAQFFCQKAVE